MARKKTKEQIKHNMSQVRNSDTALEKLLCEELNRNGVTTFTRNNKTIFGKPDVAFIARKIAIFCDGDFWHGYNWANAQNEIKSNRDFWIPKIERNMQRDQEVTARLQEQGWVVLRFWGHEILKEMDYCITTMDLVLQCLAITGALLGLDQIPEPDFRTDQPSPGICVLLQLQIFLVLPLGQQWPGLVSFPGIYPGFLLRVQDLKDHSKTQDKAQP